MGEKEKWYRVQSIRFNVACLVLIVLYMAAFFIADASERKADALKEARLSEEEAAQPEEKETENNG